MKSMFAVAALAAACVLANGGSASAQCDPGLGTATLTINAMVPAVADPIGHLVPVTTTWTLAIGDTSGPKPFILVADFAITCGAFPTPWGGSVDMVGPQIILNGIFPVTAFDLLAKTPFSATLPMPTPAVCPQNFGPAVQAINFDPTNFPLPFRNTQAGQPVQNNPLVTTITVLADDAFVTVPVPCQPIKYSGTVYTSVFVSSNGQMTFTTGSTDFSPTPAEFFHGFRATTATGSNPGVCCVWGDYNRSTGVGDSIVITQDPVGQTTKIDYVNQQHWNAQVPAGSWSTTFDFANDSVQFNVAGYLASTNVETKITGVSDGRSDLLVGPNTDFSALGGLLGNNGYVSGGVGPESIMEQHAGTVLPTFAGSATATFFHIGGAPNDFQWLLTVP